VIVVDTNVVAYALIEGTQTELARRVRELDPEWRLPELWQHEYLNILATYAKQGGLPVKTAQRLWREGVRLLAPATRPADMSLSLDLAVARGVSAYDAQFIALAISLGISCVTEDRLLQRAFPGVAVSMAAFCRA
jgi:predicted nucleic acid-binding protein